jgi:hypothetical protein
MGAYGHESEARNEQTEALLRVQALVLAGSIDSENTKDMQ